MNKKNQPEEKQSPVTPQQEVAGSRESSSAVPLNGTTAGGADEVEEWKSSYLRALADYQNLERRTHEQIEAHQKKVRNHLLHKFLDVLDTIYQAEIFVKDAGLTMVKDNFLKALKEEGVEEIDLLGKQYDPHLAECIEVVPGPEKDNVIIEVASKGYKIGDEIIRPAKVKVAKKL